MVRSRYAFIRVYFTLTEMYTKLGYMVSQSLIQYCSQLPRSERLRNPSTLPTGAFQ